MPLPPSIRTANPRFVTGRFGRGLTALSIPGGLGKADSAESITSGGVNPPQSENRILSTLATGTANPAE